MDGKKTSSHKDAIRVIGDYVPRGLKGLIHCYSGNGEQAKVYMDMGFFLSFTGLITYHPQWDDLLKTMPIESILTETDAPYLTPEPERSEGEKTPEGFVRNEPTGVKRVAEHIARLRDISFEEAAEQTTKNAIELFGITIS
ncbi:MAG: TatD family hydrolase [Chloroflexi bacterium]|nr:TatD family hydrolase [Chloroflexota bacterium]